MATVFITGQNVLHELSENFQYIIP